MNRNEAPVCGCVCVAIQARTALDTTGDAPRLNQLNMSRWATSHINGWVFFFRILTPKGIGANISNR